MQIVPVISERTLEMVDIEHAGQRIQFDTAIYSTNAKIIKPSSVTFDEMFGHYNQFLAQLPLQKQADLFACYVEIKQHFDSIFDITRLTNQITRTVGRIYSIINPKELRDWVMIRSGIQYPADLALELTAEEARKEERVKMTYLRHDYQDLVVLSLALRPMAPIWGEYISLQGGETGNTHKENAALRTLRESWVMLSPAMDRMRVYLECINRMTPESDSAIIDSLSSVETPDWLLSLAVVRRLVCVGLSSTDRNSSIIAKIFNFIKSSTLRSMDRRFSGLINDKKATGSSDEADKTSTLEGYKIKQPFCDGDLVTINVYTENIEGMALYIDPTLDLNKLHACLTNISNQEAMSIEDSHRLLCQWTCAAAISPRAIDNLQKASILRVLACTQALLWHWGMVDLAMMASAVPVAGDLGVGSDIDRRVSPDRIAKLIELYPYYYKHDKAPNDTAEKLARKNNVALKAIDIAVETMVSRQWETNAPKPIQEGSYTHGKYRKFRVPPNIKELLAELIIKTETRSEWLHATEE